MKTFKGFNQDMTCRGFQYEEGKTFETDKAVACKSGFHACEYPLDCFGFYSPNKSVYHVVEQSGEISKDTDYSKVASTSIKIGAAINFAGLVKAAIEYTNSKTKKEAGSADDYGASSATGYKGASSATGYYGASSATGDYGASSATGNCGASSATGHKGASEAAVPEAIAVAWGYMSKARGVKGSYIVLAEWEGIVDDPCHWNQEDWKLKKAKMFLVDGKKIKENVWYRLVDGKAVEVEED